MVRPPYMFMYITDEDGNIGFHGEGRATPYSEKMLGIKRE